MKSIKAFLLLTSIFCAALALPAHADSAEPLAEVGNSHITGAKVDADLAFAPKENLKGLLDTNKRFADYVSDLAYAYAKIAAADKAGLTKSPEYQRELEQFERRLAIKLWQNSVARPIDEEAVHKAAQDYYDAHPAEFSRAGQVRLAVIRQTFPEGVSDAVRKTERETAEKALRLLKSGSDFLLVAQTLSDDPAVRQANGELGWVDPTTLSAEAAKALKGLKPGDTTGIVEEPQSFSIYKVQERAGPDAKISFGEVKVGLYQRFEIEARIAENKRQRALLEKSFPVTLNPKAIEAYRQAKLKTLEKSSK
jgi:hypothetical protein